MFFLCPAVLRKDLTYKRQQEQIGLSATLNSTVLQHTSYKKGTEKDWIRKRLSDLHIQEETL